MFIILIISGVIIGLLTGLFGIGGAILMVPLVMVVLLAKHVGQFAAIHLAIGTSVTTATITTIPAIWQHHKLKNINWHLFFKYLLAGAMIGAVLGSLAAGYIQADILKIFFGICVLLIGIFMFYKALKPSQNEGNKKTHGLVHSIISFIISFVSGLIGIGGVSIMTSVLTRDHSIHRSIGTSTMYGLPVTLVAAITYIIMGISNHHLPLYTTGYVYWPAVISFAVTALIFSPIGAKIGAKISPRKLKGLFGILLIIASVASLI